MLGVDLDRCAHARAQRRIVRPGGEQDADRHALHDLDPIAGRVLRRQDGEFRSGAGADAGDRALEIVIGIGVDVDRHLLARPHIGEVGLLEIGLDPDIEANQREE
jgi:hypothetical protein